MYIYERYNFRIFTLLLGMMTVMFLVHAAYAGALISAALAVLLTFSFQGIKIDMEGKRFIQYDRFLMITIGRWEVLPPPSYVTIVRINLSNQRTTPAPFVMPESGKGARSFKVNLVVEHDMRYIPICRGSLDKMKEEALRLGKTLDIRVLDFTTPDKHWIL